VKELYRVPNPFGIAGDSSAQAQPGPTSTERLGISLTGRETTPRTLRRGHPMRFNAELNQQLPTFPNAEKKSRKIMEKLVGSGTLFQGCGFWGKVFLKREH
jgi:hypothetical protein